MILLDTHILHRLIVATALAGHQLVTADLRILNWSGALNRLRAKD